MSLPSRIYGRVRLFPDKQVKIASPASASKFEGEGKKRINRSKWTNWIHLNVAKSTAAPLLLQRLIGLRMHASADNQHKFMRKIFRPQVCP